MLVGDSSPLRLDIFFRRDLAVNDEFAFLFGIKGIDLGSGDRVQMVEEYGASSLTSYDALARPCGMAPFFGAAARIKVRAFGSMPAALGIHINVPEDHY